MLLGMNQALELVKVPLVQVLKEHTRPVALKGLDVLVAIDVSEKQIATPRYFSTIQVLRGVAALMVVVFHLVDAERIYGHGPMLLDGVARLGFAGVDLFFVISGFVMASVTQGLYGSAKNATLFLARRIARIYPMYWLFTSVIVAMMFVMPHTMDATFFAKSKIASYLLWPRDPFPLLIVGWTLTYEMFFYLVMGMAIATIRERHLPLLFVTWAVVVLIAQQFAPPQRWLTVVTSPMAWEFIAGGLIGIYWRKVPAAAARSLLWIGVIGAMVSAVVLSRMNLVEQDAMRRTLVFGAAGALIVLGLVSREGVGQVTTHRALRAVGDASYSLYLSHLFVITLAARAWAHTGHTGTPGEHAAFVITAVLLSTAVALVCYYMVERPVVRKLESFVRPVRGEGSAYVTAAPAVERV